MCFDFVSVTISTCLQSFHLVHILMSAFLSSYFPSFLRRIHLLIDSSLPSLPVSFLPFSHRVTNFLCSNSCWSWWTVRSWGGGGLVLRMVHCVLTASLTVPTHTTTQIPQLVPEQAGPELMGRVLTNFAVSGKTSRENRGRWGGLWEQKKEERQERLRLWKEKWRARSRSRRWFRGKKEK